ncbi:MAG: SDR family NAD(P)-dependent oxidoreductase [Clostridia bacterium]
MEKIVVITGASSGIGKELADLFKKQNAQVFSLARSFSGESEFEIKCDVTSEESVKSAFAKIKATAGKIDLLINNAGYGVYGATELISLDEAKRQFDVNFFGVLSCIQSALPQLGRGSRIVNISSCCAIFPLPFRTLYCASKSAVSSLGFGMRMELANAGIDVTTICPGDIKTTFTKNRVKVFESNEKYGDSIKLASEFMESKNEKRIDVASACKKIAKICNKQKTKTMYIIGKKYKVLNFFSKILPINFMQNCTNKMFNKKK